MSSRLQDLDAEGKFDITRQRDIFDSHAHESAHCTLVGCGGIGSVAGLALTKLGIPSLTVIDFDAVEPHNLPNQMFPLAADGKNKAAVAKQLWERWGASDVVAINDKVQNVSHELRGVVIGGLDNMEARKYVWETVKNNLNVELLIDGRLGGQEMNIYAINPANKQDQEYYEEWGIFDEEEGLELPCTERGVIDVSFEIAAKITRLVRRHYGGQPLERLTIINHKELELTTS